LKDPRLEERDMLREGVTVLKKLNAKVDELKEQTAQQA
jgi:hypothetical protein